MRIELCRSCGMKIIPSPNYVAVCVVCGPPQKLLGSKRAEKSTVKVHSHDFNPNNVKGQLVIMNSNFGGARY